MIDKSAMRRCFILGGLMLLVLGLCKWFPNAATDPQTGMVVVLPDSIAGHVTLERKPEEKETDLLPKDTGILKRSYLPIESLPPRIEELSEKEQAAALRKAMPKGIHATLILSGNDPRSLHKPSVCLDGQGWVITKKDVVPLVVNGQPLEVMDFTMFREERENDGSLIRRRAHYIYWWIGKNRSTPHDWDRVITSDLDNLLRNVNNRWGYPSVMIYLDPAQEDGDRLARERAYDWIRNYAPVFQKSLAAESAVAASTP